MQKTIDEIFFKITEGLKIKHNSPTENRLQKKALHIYNHERFIYLKSKALELSNSIIKLKIADEEQFKRLKHSQNFDQFRDVLIEFFDGFLDIIEFVKIDNMEIQSERLKNKEISLITDKYKREAKSDLQKFNNLKKNNALLLNNNKRLEKEINKYRTPTKRIKNKVDAFIELIKKEPDKIPSSESLADFSKGKEFELGRTRWYELINTYTFITEIITALTIEEDKMWERCGKYKKSVNEMNEKIASEKDIEILLLLNKQRDKLLVNSEKYEKFANVFIAIKKIYEKKQSKLDKRREQFKPKIENVLTKKAIESMINLPLSESDYKKLEFELKNTILDFINNNL